MLGCRCGEEVLRKISCLIGNFVEASVINIKMLEISSSGELLLSRSFVPVCSMIT